MDKPPTAAAAAGADDPNSPQANAVQGNDLRTTVGGLNAIAGIQANYYAGKIPRAAAVANVQLLFGFSPAEAASLFPEIAPTKLTPDDAPAAGDSQAAESVRRALKGQGFKLLEAHGPAAAAAVLRVTALLLEVA